MVPATLTTIRVSPSVDAVNPAAASALMLSASAKATSARVSPPEIKAGCAVGVPPSFSVTVHTSSA